MDRLKVKTEAKVKEIRVKQDGADVKFDGLSFTGEQHKALVEVVKTGETIMVTVEQSPLELFEQAAPKTENQLSLFRQDFANNDAAFSMLIATAARESRDHTPEDFSRMEAWDNAKNEESYQLKLMAAAKAGHYGEVIALASALWNFKFFEAPQCDTPQKESN